MASSGWGGRTGGDADPELRQRLAGYRWRREPATRSGRRRGPRAAVAAAAYLGFSGLLVWVALLLLPPRPACLVLAGAGYEADLSVPHNAYGRAALRALNGLAAKSAAGWLWPTRKLRVAVGPRVLKRTTDPLFERGLPAFPERTVVVYLALHGVVDHRDGAALLLDGSDPADPVRGRVPLQRVLDRLADPKLAGKHKVLVLDATGVEADWSHGALRNDFAAVVGRLGPKIEAVPNLVVISASGPGERSWPAPEWGETAFGHYFVEGLAGAAAGGKTRLDAGQLFHYVRGKVAGWAKARHGVAQTPVLLPAGAVGERRAAAAELAGGLGGPPTPGEAAKTPEPSDDLRRAWLAYEAAARSDPHPSAYAPHLWSRFQATVLRCDELERARDPASARALAAGLDGQRREIDAARVVRLASGGNSLAMPAAEGRWPLAPARPHGELFESLWTHPPDADRLATWNQATKPLGGPDHPDVRRLRAEMVGLCLDRVTEDRGRNLATAVEVIRAVDPPPGRPRAAEAHDLLMARDRDDASAAPAAAAGAAGDAFEAAVLARRRGEHAALGVGGGPTPDPVPVPKPTPGAFRTAGTYPYAELVEPWVRPLVDRGDAARRVGQDLLFAGEDARWKESLGRLRDANAAYAEALAGAADVRDAVALRDAVLPVLPEYTKWLVRRPGAPAPDPALADVEALWDDLHELTRWLERPQPGSFAPTGRDLAGRVRTRFGAVQAAFASAVRSKAPRSWREAEALLAVPFFHLDPDAPASAERLALLKSWRDASHAAAPPGPAADPDAPSREARGALAVLGGRLFRDAWPPKGAEDDYTRWRAQARAGRLAAGSADVLAVGRKIGDLMAGMADGVTARPLGVAPPATAVDVAALLAPGLRGPKETEGEAEARLERADRLLRGMTGGAADRLARLLRAATRPGLNVDSPQAFRRLRLRALLARQGGRAYEDHWAAADPRADAPYYRTAGKAYAADARAMDPAAAASSTPPALAALDADLARDDLLRLSGPDRRDVTSEREIDLEYEVDVPDGPLRRGRPVLWPGGVAGLRFTPERGGREPVDVSSNTPPKLFYRLEAVTDEEGAPASGPSLVPTDVRVFGLYRGQRVEFTTRLDRYLAADVIVARRPRPDAARVSVGADDPVLKRIGQARGAVAFVLDASGSMVPRDGPPTAAGTKYALAVRALEDVMRELPAGLIVSVYQFGAARPGRAEVPAEETIDVVLPAERWDPSRLPAVTSRLRASEPWDRSPIVRTILLARRDLIGLGDVGFKSIVVLTDGDDNRFAVDKLANPRAQSVPEFLREAFRDTDVQLNVVGFHAPDPSTEARMRDQFAVVAGLPVPGRFYYADDIRDLLPNLRVLIRQQLNYRLVDEGGGPLRGVSAVEAPVGSLRDDGDPGRFPSVLSPGGYQVRLTLDDRVRRDIALDGGDQLLLSLVDRGGVVNFERRLYPLRPLFGREPASAEAGRWRFSAPRASVRPDRSLEVLALLERIPDPQTDPATIRLPRPGEVWVELTAGSGGDAPPVRFRGANWFDRDGFPAPAWRVVAPDWPAAADGAAAPPVLSAWWREGAEAPPSALIESGTHFHVTRAGRDRGAPVVDATAATDRRIDAGGVSVTVEGVRTEVHRVETADGAFDEKPCLVVRLAYPRGKRVWARPRGATASGEEHRFYDAAGRYTGLFWTTASTTALEHVTAIELIEAEAFKDACRRDGTAVEMSLPRPTADLSPALVPAGGSAGR